MDALDEHDDVDAVHANFDIPADAARAGRGLEAGADARNHRPGLVDYLPVAEPQNLEAESP